MGFANDLWLDTPGLPKSMRIFRRVTFAARAKSKMYGLTISLLRAASKDLWATYHRLTGLAKQRVDADQTDHFQASGYTLLALHKLYRQEYVPFARSGRVGGLAHFKEGLKPLDELQSLLPNLAGLKSFFNGQYLAYRFEWLTRPQQFGLEPDGWETQYDSKRRECERQLEDLRTHMIAPVEVAIVFLDSHQWEQAIDFCSFHPDCSWRHSQEIIAEAHTMIGEILAASDFAPRTRETFDQAITMLQEGLKRRMHQRLHYTIAFLHTLYVRPEVFGFPQEWTDYAADQKLWVKADKLIAGMPCSARVPHANSYGLTEALAGIHEQFPGKTIDREKCLHYAERTIRELSSSPPRKDVESYDPLAQYWIGYMHDVLTPTEEKNVTIFIQACEGYVAYVEQMLLHGNRWDPSHIARVYSLLHLPKQRGFLDATDEVRVPFMKRLDQLCQTDAARPLEKGEPEFRRFSFIWSQLSRFSIGIDLDDAVLAARQQELFESVPTTAASEAAPSSHHCALSSSCAEEEQDSVISRLHAEQNLAIAAARRLEQIHRDPVLHSFYLGFQREMHARIDASRVIGTGMVAKDVGDVRVTIASNVISLIPVLGSTAQSIFDIASTAVLEMALDRYANNVRKIAINPVQTSALVQDIALAVLTQPGMSQRLQQLNKDKKNNLSWFERLTRFASGTAHKIQELFNLFADPHDVFGTITWIVINLSRTMRCSRSTCSSCDSSLKVISRKMSPSPTTERSLTPSSAPIFSVGSSGRT